MHVCHNFSSDDGCEISVHDSITTFAVELVGVFLLRKIIPFYIISYLIYICYTPSSATILIGKMLKA
jgi:hypothetical protein